jgi:hypothetical protein
MTAEQDRKERKKQVEVEVESGKRREGEHRSGLCFA